MVCYPIVEIIVDVTRNNLITTLGGMLRRERITADTCAKAGAEHAINSATH